MGKWRYMMVAAVWVAGIGQAFGQADGGNLQRRLDRPVQLAVDNKPILEVFEQLSRVSGVPIEVHEDTLAMLPYGSETHLNVTIQDMTLREALPRMLAPQALSWTLEDETIVIVPSESLYRMGRRCTFEELQLLGRMQSRRVQWDGAENLAAALEAMTERQGLRVILPVAMTTDDESRALRHAAQALPGTTAEFLDMFCQSGGYTWYVDDDRIVVLPCEDQIRRQLQRKVSLRYQDTRLVTVLLDLTRKGRVKLVLTPGVLQSLPGESRESFTLIMTEASIEQALEIIAGATGLDFGITPEGVVVRSSLYLEVMAGTQDSDGQQEQRRRIGFFLRTSVPLADGREVELFILPRDLPEEVREAMDRRRQEVIEELLRSYRDAETVEP